jgi:SAM-dependent methyltransferase
MKCRLCDSDRLILYYTQGNRDEFRFYRCPVCKLVNYDISCGIDQEKYAQEYVDPFDETITSNRAQTLTHRFLKAHVRGPGRMLEIGCGNGRLLHLARQDGWTVRGLELFPFLAESVKQRLGIDVGVANFLEYRKEGGESYDLVLLRHVLEHLPDSKGAMRSIGSLLADGGHALLEFPNIEALDIRFQRWQRKNGLHRRTYPEGYRPGHCNEFCRESFEHLLKETGFELVVWETYSYRPVSNFIFNRVHIGNKARVILRKL